MNLMNQNLSKDEAKQALREGHKIVHSGFTSDEWMRRGGRGYIFEDGCTCTPSEFWQYRTEPWWEEGWKIIEFAS